MSTPVTITDEDGNTVFIIDRGLVVTNNAMPAPASSELTQIPIVMNLKVDGTGSADLTVNGSTDSIDAFVEARSDGDLYLKTANLVIEGTGNLQLEDFGDIAGGLTIGIDTFIENQGVRFPITQIPIVTNLDAIRIGTLTPALGVDANAFRIKQTQGGGDTLYNPVWDLERLAAGTEGIVLAAGTKQKLGITINDDLTGLTSFNILAIGYLRLT